MSCKATAGAQSEVSVDSLKLHNVLDLLRRDGLFQVYFVGIEQVRYIARNLLVLKYNLELASRYIDSHFVGAVHNKYNTTDSV